MFTAIDRIKQTMKQATREYDAGRIPRTHTSGTSVYVRRGRTGPSYDPYGYEELTVWRHGLAITFTGCGLRGEKCEVKAPAKDRFGRDSMRTIAETDWCFDCTKATEAVELFKRFAGEHPGQFMHWYEERIYQPDPMGSLSSYE